MNNRTPCLLLLVSRFVFGPCHLAEISAAYTIPESEGEMLQTRIESNYIVVLVEVLK